MLCVPHQRPIPQPAGALPLSPIPPLHSGPLLSGLQVECDLCSVCPIIGPRYHSLSTPNFDLVSFQSSWV